MEGIRPPNFPQGVLPHADKIEEISYIPVFMLEIEKDMSEIILRSHEFGWWWHQLLRSLIGVICAFNTKHTEGHESPRGSS